MTSQTNARRRATLWLAIVCVAVLGAVCEAPTGSEPGNRAPETYLSISDAELDTTFYVVDLSWWGEDSDGDVSHFEYWWDYFQPAIPGTSFTSDTVVTVETHAVFTLPVSGTRAQHTMHVRAVDDDGLADPTPVVQEFRLWNELSRVSFGDDLLRPARSLPGVTFSLRSTDPDGADTIIGYLFWFEGTDRLDDGFFAEAGDEVWITLGPDAFPQAGTVTVHFQSIDESSSASADTASHTWDVIDTEGKRLLVVDHYPDGFQFGTEVDAFYLDAASTVYDADEIIDLAIESDGAFQTDAEVELAFSAFESVIWYSGLQPSDMANSLLRRDELRVATRGMRPYVEGGGNLFVQSQFLFGDLLPNQNTIDFHAAWDSVAAGEMIGIEWPYDFIATNINTNFAIFPGRELSVAPGLASAPLRLQSPTVNQEFYPLPPEGSPIAWFPPGQVTIGFDGDGLPVLNDTDFHAAFSLDLPGDGSFVAMLLPLARSNGNGSASETLVSILQTFAPPPPAATRGTDTLLGVVSAGASRHAVRPLPAEIREQLEAD